MNKAGLRRGYTTGSCAAAAAKAAALMLVQGRAVSTVDIVTPGGVRLELEVKDQQRNGDKAVCGVVKDSGDDPDVTAGIVVYAQVRPKGAAGEVVIRGGEGVGVVTKPGLQVMVNQPAINPVPRQMITLAVSQVWPLNQGLEVTISAPRGRWLARRTLNPRLGIVGGISILGTTGIVEPRSVDAYKVSLSLALDLALAAGMNELVLVPGNLGEGFARRYYALKPEEIIQMGNQVGFMLRECKRKGVSRVILLGHIGKLVKVAAGIFDTSSRVADSRLETIAHFTREVGADSRLVNQIERLPLAEASIPLLRQAGLLGVFEVIAQAVSRRARQHVEGGLEVGCQLYSLNGELVGQDGVARRWSEERCRPSCI
jgi:cobalt-precorrin-5B (C1)-methyltransferase